MITHAIRAVLLCLVPLSIVCTPEVGDDNAQPSPSTGDVRKSEEEFNEEEPLVVHYLEIVTPEVDATCEALESIRGVSFGEPIPELGNARTAPLNSGGRIGVRAPMRETEEPLVRPYLLVEDIEAALDAALYRTRFPGQVAGLIRPPFG